MAAIAGNRVIAERRTRSVTERTKQEKRQRSHSPLRGLFIAVPVGAAMWAVIIWVLRLVIF
jgi:cell division septal protein FtsQ